MSKIFIVFFLFVFSLQKLNAAPSFKSLAYSKAWLNLLYYKQSGDTYKSLVSKEIFFVDRQAGATNPLKELKKTVEVFQKVWPASESHPQCLYPSRYSFLAKHFQLSPPVVCTRYEQWKRSYAPEALNLVYASQFISNPASVFGHSFLLLSSKKQTRSFWLTYNYAGNIPTNISGLAYVYGGMTGWYAGDYSVMPLHTRMFQYGSIENRDLWSYEIKLSPEELDFFLKHLWEIVHAAEFSYYFLDENCAGMLLRTLAATLSDFRDESHLDFYVHPIEVIKSLAKRDRLGKLDLIPSQSRKLDYYYKQQSSKEKSDFLSAIWEKKETTEVKYSEKTLDALIEYLAYVKNKSLGKTPEDLMPLERSVYLQRSKMPPSEGAEVVLQSYKENAPHLSHESTAFMVGLSFVNDTKTMDLSYRFVIHDLMDREAGYISNSTIEFMNINLSVAENEIWAKDVTLVNIENLQPFFSYRESFSWRIKVAVMENLLTENMTDGYANTKISYGLSREWLGQLFYLMLNADVQWGRPDFQSPVDLGPEAGFIFSKDRVKLFLSGFWGQDYKFRQDNEFLKAQLKFRYSLGKNSSFLQLNEYIRKQRQDLSGYRSSVNLRIHF